MPAPSRCPVTSLSVAKDVVGAYARRGTLNNWKNTVGTLANDHRLLRFYTTAALAGALLHIGGFESGCFHLFGLSSMGKTTCLRMAASVWGSGADGGYVRTWRSTANGLEATLAGANDTCLPLDEVGQADGRELGQALYMATGGVGKQRMRRDASLKPSHVWRVLALSTGEQPIETKLNEDAKRGTRAHAGQLVRAIDIRVHRTHGVSDCLKVGEVSPKAFADQCKSAASAHYGTARPEFVRQLVAHNISEKDGLRRQRQICVGGDIADIAVVVDKTDPAVTPLEPHDVARLRISAVFEHRDHFPTLEPGRGEPRAIDLGVQREEQSNVRTADAKRALMQLDVVGQQRPQVVPVPLVEARHTAPP